MIRTFALSLVLVLFLVSPAEAAVVLSPTDAAAGQTIDLRLTVTAEAQPTTRVELKFTDPSIEVGDTAFIDGWSATLDRDSDDLISSATWDKGEIAAGQSETFIVTLTIPETSDRIEMTALQASADGTVTRVPSTGESFGISVNGATGQSTTTTTSFTSTTVAPDPETTPENSKARGVGFYLIAFGVVVILAMYVRTKRRVAKSLNERD